MAPQLETVDVALNAFYGYPMLSPTTRSQQNKNTGINRDNILMQKKKKKKKKKTLIIIITKRK